MIKNGSDKQNEWAEKIVDGWAKQIDTELFNLNIHTYAGTIKPAIEKMEQAKIAFLAGIEKVTATEVINLHTANRNIATILIAKAKA